MGELSNLFESSEVRPATAVQRQLAAGLAAPLGLDAYPGSLASAPGGAALLARRGMEKKLVLLAPLSKAPAWLSEFAGDRKDAAVEGVKLACVVCALSHANASALRKTFLWLRPQTFGLKTSAGLGDRLGLGTPGHMRAAGGTGIVPFLAQQSIREMTRTGRTAEEVMDDAMWGVFQAGWTSGFGSDADHLKTTADIDTCAAAGFTMFTVDPGDHVDNSADAAAAKDLAAKVEALDWRALETSAADLRKSYLAGKVNLAGGVTLAVSEEMLLRAAAKYGAAVAHTAVMYRHLVVEDGRAAVRARDVRRRDADADHHVRALLRRQRAQAPRREMGVAGAAVHRRVRERHRLQGRPRRVRARLRRAHGRRQRPSAPTRSPSTAAATSSPSTR